MPTTRNTCKRFLASHLPTAMMELLRDVRIALLDPYATRAYSQEGEDMILRRAFGDEKVGFYVDVGAHHPRRFSNTYYFYRRGWKGINIDAMPGSMRAFRRGRPRDKNIEAAIADGRCELTFYIFDDLALNTFDGVLARKRVRQGYRVVQTAQVHARTLADLLGEHLPEGQPIDFMSIDVEGFELPVVRSNDWQLFRPTYLLVEILEMSVEDVIESELYALLGTNGYTLFAKTSNTAVFRDVRGNP